MSKTFEEKVKDFVDHCLGVFKENVLLRSQQGKDPNDGMPMQLFFFGEKDEIVCFGENMMLGKHDNPLLSEKQILVLLTRLISLSMPAKVVVHLAETWMARQCVCGADYMKGKETAEDVDMNKWKCPNCDSGYVPPSKNPNRKEYVQASVVYRDKEKNCSMYMYEIIRDAHGTMIGFGPAECMGDMEASGNFVDYWSVYQEFTPHFIVNLPVFLEQFGHDAENAKKIAEIVKATKPEGYPLVEFNASELRHLKEAANVN